jgi:DNA polymerase III epsilon subunit-like protein
MHTKPDHPPTPDNMKLMIFDTETTGLPPKNRQCMDPAQWPHIVQLSYLVYDTEADKIQSFKDVIISLGTHIPLPDESVAIHGITRSMSLERGIDIRVALFDFKMELQQCGKCVAHNYEFDSNMLEIEARRHNMSLYFPSPFCTMRVGTDLCKLTHPTFTGGGYKWPKLLELHEHLFHRVPKNTHNSKIDVIVTLRCYHWLVHNEDLCRSSREFRALFRNHCTIECDRDDLGEFGDTDEMPSPPQPKKTQPNDE